LFLILASSLTSCYNEPGFLGNNLLPDDDIYQVELDSSFKLSAYTLTMDTLNTFGSSEGFIGYICSEEFGSTKASFVGSFLPNPISEEGFGGPTAKADSLFFYLTVSGFSGDTLTPLQLKVHELTNRSLFFNKAINALKPIDGFYNPEPFFTATLQGIKTLKVPLPLDYAQTLMDSLALSDTSVFLEKFKGFYITVDELDGFGGVCYSVPTTAMFMTLYYHYTDANNDIKTSSKSFFFTYDKYFQYLHDVSKANPDKRIQHLNDTINQDTVFYIQNIGGVYGKIKLDSLSNWKRKMPIVVHKAQLIISRNSNSETLGDSLINQLAIYYKENGQFQGYIDDQKGTNGINTNGRYWPYNNSYSIDITYHFNKILQGDFDDNSIYVFPAPSSYYQSSILKTSNSSTPIKLIITYSKLK
jgi:hypothetical protein